MSEGREHATLTESREGRDVKREEGSKFKVLLGHLGLPLVLTAPPIVVPFQLGLQPEGSNPADFGYPD